jgi:alcohol dehydrogenase
LNNLKLVDQQLEEPNQGEVCVRIHSIGLNYADIFSVMGLYKAAPKHSFIPGLEFSGEIISVGNGTKRFKVGDKVMGVSKFGAYCTHITIDEYYVDPLPNGWSFQEGAAFPVQVLTAYYALKTLGNLEAGQTVLIHSGAGGVGLLANRIAKKMNAYTIGVIGSLGKSDLLKKEGYNEIIVRNDHFRDELKKVLKDRELNLVLETTGGKFTNWSYNAMAPMGRMVCYGSAQFTPSGNHPNYLKLAFKYLFRPKFDPLTMITENKSIMAFNLIWLYEKKELMRELMKQIEELNLDPPLVGHQFKFEKLPDALKFFKTGKSTGKIVINVM